MQEKLAELVGIVFMLVMAYAGYELLVWCFANL